MVNAASRHFIELNTRRHLIDLLLNIHEQINLNLNTYFRLLYSSLWFLKTEFDTTTK